MPHKKNFHSTKLEFLVLKWAMTKHFKVYLPYQPFLVRMDNNPLTYIMTTPNLDAMGYWWVIALTQFNFELEYEKGHDNPVADTQSWVTTRLDPVTVRSILDRVTLGTACWSKVHDPAIVSGDHWLEQVVTTDWSKRYMLPQAMHLYKCTLLIGPKPRKRPDVEHSIGLDEGTEEDRFEGTSGKTYLQWGRPADLTESAEFHNSSESLVLNTQRWDWRSSTLNGP